MKLIKKNIAITVLIASSLSISQSCQKDKLGTSDGQDINTNDKAKRSSSLNWNQLSTDAANYHNLLMANFHNSSLTAIWDDNYLTLSEFERLVDLNLAFCKNELHLDFSYEEVHSIMLSQQDLVLGKYPSNSAEAKAKLLDMLRNNQFKFSNEFKSELIHVLEITDDDISSYLNAVNEVFDASRWATEEDKKFAMLLRKTSNASFEYWLNYNDDNIDYVNWWSVGVDGVGALSGALVGTSIGGPVGGFIGGFAMSQVFSSGV